MDEPIPLFEIAWDEDDIVNAVQSIGRGSYWAKGPYVDSFENGLEDYFGVEHAITTNSGTTALVAALQACGVGEGDEVIVPSFTFIATANAVRLVGAEPVFADVERKTYGLDPESVRDCLTERSAAIVPVHVYGAPCRIQELRTIAEEADLFLVEDAAEAFGASTADGLAGTLGDAGVLSFCQNKILPTGEGGAVVTDDDELAAKVRLYRSHGRPEGSYFESVGSGEYVALGTNIRMSDLTAAVGCSQLEKVDALIDRRRTVASTLHDRLKKLDGVSVHDGTPDTTHVYQLYTITLQSDIDRDTVIEALNERGIAAKIYWDTPVHQAQYYREADTWGDAVLPVTEDLVGRVLSLPMYPDLESRQIDRIADAVEAGVARAK